LLLFGGKTIPWRSESFPLLFTGHQEQQRSFAAHRSHEGHSSALFFRQTGSCPVAFLLLNPGQISEDLLPKMANLE
jgi:hypothetical protein